MRRPQWIALSVLGLAGLLAGWIALRTDQPPMLPDDAEHRSGSSAEQCLSCHGSQGIAPRPPDHPVSRDCLRCHGAS